MLSLRSPLVRLTFFTYLALSFSSCTSSCECDVDSLPCSAPNAEYVELIRGFEKDTLRFVDQNNSMVMVVCNELDSIVEDEVLCSTKGMGQCICGDCNSSYNIGVSHIDSGVTKSGNIRYSIRQYQADPSEELSDASHNLYFNLGVINQSMALPLKDSSFQRQEYIEEFNVRGNLYKKVYRFYSLRNIEGNVQEVPGAIFYSKSEGIIGYEDPISGVLYMKAK